MEKTDADVWNKMWPNIRWTHESLSSDLIPKSQSFPLNRSNSTVDGGGTPEAEKAIMAMGKKDADILNNKLEEQFKKALGGIGKGKVGLGFSPQLDPANKKYHIDVNATKSVKF